ncbi:hypothetical protein QOZ80_3BG0294220 [Eleusine coracana subsp. coracana]|nr:hypothetical protein QOZ80_3BG0294220 [Eleusine coracana subsp. coracana]
MWACNTIWSVAKRNAMVLAIAVTISDRYVTVFSVTGESMHPTFTAASNAFRGDFILVERTCLQDYKFSHGDVVLFRCPSNHKDIFVKRVIALPGEWMQLPGYPEVVKIPEGHCWVEGDNSSRSWDSRAFGPVPLGLVTGRVTHIFWPPSKIGKVERKVPKGRVAPF